METITFEWLEKQCAIIELTGTLQEKMALVGIVYEMLPLQGETEKKQQIVGLFSGLSTRTFQRYKKEHFKLSTKAEIKTIQKKVRNSDANIKESFSIRILDKESKNLIGLAFCNFAKMFFDPTQYFKKEKNSSSSTKGNLNESEIEATAIRICETHSMGRKTIEECCDQENIKFDAFVNWALKYPHIKQMFVDSSKFAIFLNNSRIISMVNKRIQKILDNGQQVSETTTSQKITLPSILINRLS